MGNKNSTNFNEIDTTNNEAFGTKLFNLTTDKFKEMVDRLELCFEDKNYIKNYKKSKKNNQENYNKETELDNDVVQEDENQSEISDLNKFLKTISNLIKFELASNEYQYYIKILEIYKILISEKEFLTYFIKNSLEQLSSMITTIEEKEKNYVTSLYKTATELMIMILDSYKKNSKLIDNIINLRKIMVIATKLNDVNFFKNLDLKLNLILIFKLSITIINSQLENSRKSKEKKENLDFFRDIINEYFNNSIFTKLTDDLVKNEDTESNLITIQAFQNLVEIEFVIKDSYIKCGQEIYNILEVSKKTTNDQILKEILIFLIKFLMNCYNQETHYSNTYTFNDELLLESFFEIFEKNENKFIKFLVSCLFVCLSINEELWLKLKSLCIIKVTTLYIHEFIFKTYSKNNKNDLDSKEIIYFFIRKIMSYFTKTQSYRTIYHIDFYSNYLNIITLLYYINDENIRQDILYILNTFSYYYDCKIKILTNTYKYNIVENILKRLDILKSELDKCKELYKECKISLDENKNLKVTAESDMVNIFEDNIILFEDSKKQIENFFMKTTDEFISNISIIISLMMNHDYNNHIEKVIKNDLITKFDSYELLFKDNNLDFIEKKYKADFTKYILQIKFARYIYIPKNLSKVNASSFIDIEVSNLNDYLNLLKTHDDNQDILHKIVYCIYRFLEVKKEIKNETDVIKKIAYELKKKIYLFNSSVIINRECLRLLCFITMYSENTILWLKFDSNKVHLDYSNFSDIILKYKNNEAELNPFKKDFDIKYDKILFPPYKKVKAYADKMGVIFYSEHSLVLPKRLKIGDSFTVAFRFFNPVPDTGKFHVLLQDPTGLGGLIVIHSDRKSLGCFTKDGVFIDSGINLLEQELQKKWLHVVMSCLKQDDLTQLQFYLDRHQQKNSNTKVTLPKEIQYIGNSRDFNEPFGIFCDLRVYPMYCDNSKIQSLFSDDNNKKVDKVESDLLNFVFHQIIDSNFIDNFLKSNDTSEETFYYSIKLINNVMANRSYRTKFLKYELIMKILGYFDTRKRETKKEISKFLLTIS